MGKLNQILLDRSGGDANLAEQERVLIRSNPDYAKRFLNDIVPNFDRMDNKSQQEYLDAVSPRASTLETAGTIAKSFLGGAEAGLAGIADALNMSTQESSFANWLRQGKAYQETQTPDSEAMMRLGSKGRFAANVAGTIGGMTPMVAGSVVNPVLGATLGGITAYGQAEETARQRDMNPEDITSYASMQGLAEGATELIPFGKVLGKIPGRTGKVLGGLLGEQSSAEATQRLAKGMTGLKEFGQRLVSENVQENVTSVLQREIDKAYNMPVPSLSETLAETTALTTAVTAILGGGGKLANRMMNNRAVGSQVANAPIYQTGATTPEYGQSTPYNAQQIMDAVNMLSENNVEPTATNIVDVLRNGEVTKEEVGGVQSIIDDMQTKNLANMTEQDFNTALQESINRVTGIERQVPMQGEDINTGIQNVIDERTGISQQTEPQTFNKLRAIDRLVNAEPQQQTAPIALTQYESMTDLHEANQNLFDDNGRISKDANPADIQNYLEQAKFFAQKEINAERNAKAGVSQQEIMQTKEKALPKEQTPMDEESLYKYHRRMMNQAKKETPSLVTVIRNMGTGDERGGISTKSLRNMGVSNINESAFKGVTKPDGLPWDIVYRDLVDSGHISEAPSGTNAFDHLKNQLLESKKLYSKAHIEDQARLRALHDMDAQENFQKASEQIEATEQSIFKNLPDCPF